MNNYWRNIACVVIKVFLAGASANIGIGYACAAQEYKQVPALIQVSSTMSDGKYSLPRIAGAARQSGFPVVIVTDRDYMRWEYGIWPLRNLIKKTVENNSLAFSGIQNYFDTVAAVQKTNPDMVFIPGVESTPFYYWSGKWFKGTLTLNNTHNHLIVIGLSPAQIRHMPVIGNRFARLRPFHTQDSWRLWPLMVLLSGAVLLIKRKPRQYRNSLEKEAARRALALMIGVTCIGGVFAINDFPFQGVLFDQYHGDQGAATYQQCIDYVNAQGGLVFWAHPEARNSSSANGVTIITEPHAQDFLTTKGYAGFCVFYEGYGQIGRPGGLWDAVLNEGLNGKREKPVWALGGLAFDYDGDLISRAQDLRTVIAVKELTQQGVLDAMRHGNMYVMKGAGSGQFVLDEFKAENADKDTAGMGETLVMRQGYPLLKIKGHFQAKTDVSALTIRLIRNGSVIKTFESKGEFAIEYRDPDFLGERGYYRIEITGLDLHLVANPIFVIYESTRIAHE